MNGLASEEVYASPPEIGISGAGMADLLRGVLARGASFRFRASGSSMTPFIRSDDILVISPLAGALPRFGQVIAFVNPAYGNLVVHRLVGRRRTGGVLRGDNCPIYDAADIPFENMLGVVTSIERSGRAIRFSLGIERVPIALFSRLGLLSSLFQLLSKAKFLASIIIKRAHTF